MHVLSTHKHTAHSQNPNAYVEHMLKSPLKLLTNDQHYKTMPSICSAQTSVASSGWLRAERPRSISRAYAQHKVYSRGPGFLGAARGFLLAVHNISICLVYIEHTYHDPFGQTGTQALVEDRRHASILLAYGKCMQRLYPLTLRLTEEDGVGTR